MSELDLMDEEIKLKAIGESINRWHEENKYDFKIQKLERIEYELQLEDPSDYEFIEAAFAVMKLTAKLEEAQKKLEKLQGPLLKKSLDYILDNLNKFSNN